MISLKFRIGLQVASYFAKGGDYDYHKAIDELQRKGIIVEVAYFRKQGISKDLIRLADRFINLEDIIDRIRKM